MIKLSRYLKSLIVSSSVLLIACNQQAPTWNSGTLVIIIPETSQGAKAEFERDLAQLFADELKSSLEVLTMSQEQAILHLQKHQAHLATLSLRKGIESADLKFGPSYQTVKELVVCNGRLYAPKSLSKLGSRKLAVVAGSAEEIALRESQLKLPSLSWLSLEKISPRELLQKVANEKIDCAAVNELQLADAYNYHPNLIAAFDFAAPSRIVWGFPRDVSPELFIQVQKFFDLAQHDGTINRLLERYYGHNLRLAKMDAAAFISKIRTTLPHYRHYFEEAGSETGEDWRLLAALAYQESQWNPNATSRTSVRGMMMLTEDTADRMKLSNRLDARESIFAGAKYFALLKDQMPSRIPEPDRTWMALAAYNQGYSHLEDARILTERAGKNPDSWLDVKKWMPLLNQQGYYETLKHGYARGGEAVILVENIRNYYDILKRLKPQKPGSISETISYRLIEPLQEILH